MRRARNSGTKMRRATVSAVELSLIINELASNSTHPIELKIRPIIFTLKVFTNFLISLLLIILPIRFAPLRKRNN